MARRKYEFRPDKTRSNFLSRLTPTRQQRMNLLKWGLYIALMVLASVLQDVVLCKTQLFGATTDLVPYAIILICVRRGADRSAVFCLISAMLYKFSGTAPGYYVIALLPLLALPAAMVHQSYFRKSLGSTMLCACTAILIYEMCVLLFGLGLGHTTGARAVRFLITGLLSVAVCPILYPIINAIEKIGEKTWKD